MNPTVTLRPRAGFEWPCPHCHGINMVHTFTPCVTCPNCGLQCDAQVQADPLACLNERECHILMLIAEGNTNKEIGTKLELAPSTTRNLVSEVFDKIKVSNRAEAAALATRVLSRTPKTKRSNS
jgi:DNA-binding CsgD family transcriptional regulator